MNQILIRVSGAPCSGKTVFSTKLYLEFLERGESSVELIQEEAGRLIRNGYSPEEATKVGNDIQTKKELDSKAEILIVESPAWVRDWYARNVSNSVTRSRPEDFEPNGCKSFFLLLPPSIDEDDVLAEHRDQSLDPHTIQEGLLKRDPNTSWTVPFDFDERAKVIRQFVDNVIFLRDSV